MYGVSSNSGTSEPKPFLHRWSVIAPAVGVAITACVALTVGFCAPKSSTNTGDPKSTNPSGVRQYSASPDLGGWGPDREMFPGNSPSTYAVLNSINDSPSWGDERQFVACKRADSDEKYGWSSVAARGLTEIVVTTWIENASSIPGQDVTNATMQIVLPEHAADDPSVGVYLNSPTSRIKQVWSGCRILTDLPSVVSVKPGSVSATTGSSDAPEEHQLGDGVLYGTELLPGTQGGAAGVIPASVHSYGIVRFTLVVQPVK